MVVEQMITQVLRLSNQLTKSRLYRLSNYLLEQKFSQQIVILSAWLSKKLSYMPNAMA